MSERLRSEQRIRKRPVFHLIFNKGKQASGTLLNLWIYSGPGATEPEAAPKLGLIVSRKTSPRAAVRNLWKRRIREAFRKNQNKIKKGIAVLIQSRAHGKPPAYNAIEAELGKLLRKTESLLKP